MSNRSEPIGTAMAPELWQASVTVAAADAAAAEAALEPAAVSVSRFEAAADSPLWRIDALFHSRPDRSALAAALGPLSDGLKVAPLPHQNWVAESLRHLPPVVAGRFHVHGAHHPRHANPAKIDLLIEAGLAFGSGQHESTLGCLIMLDRLAKSRHFRQVLDLGCGSGVLGLAAAGLWHRPVLASDIDPVAVRVTAANARQNRLAPLVRTRVANGLGDRYLVAKGPYDLIMANILARPLIRLAPAMTRQLGRDGVIVLAGLLASQERMVLAAYRLQGLLLVRRLVLGAWCTLVLARRKTRNGHVQAGA